MNDPVSQELERRLGQPLRWRSALAVAVGIHLVVALALLTGPSGRRRALSLPRVQVRLTAGVPAPAGNGGGPAHREGPAASRPAAAVSRPEPKAAAEKPKPRPPAAAPQKRKQAQAVTPKKAPAVERKKAEPVKRTAEPAEKKAEPAGRTQTGADAAAAPAAADGPPAASRAPSAAAGSAAGAASGGAPGGVGLGSGGSGATDESFPFTYYLNRVLTIIESNWFRPPAAAGTQCRVLCRIDRSGRLVEAGIEVPSTTPAFDRAALRAVYASAPLPPLPQAYPGSTLTLHLEFGP